VSSILGSVPPSCAERTIDAEKPGCAGAKSRWRAINPEFSLDQFLSTRPEAHFQRCNGKLAIVIGIAVDF
jgi:hypothetical protein